MHTHSLHRQKQLKWKLNEPSEKKFGSLCYSTSSQSYKERLKAGTAQLGRSRLRGTSSYEYMVGAAKKIKPGSSQQFPVLPKGNKHTWKSKKFH